MRPKQLSVETSELAQYEGYDLVDSETRSYMEGLTRAHEGYDDAGALNDNEIEALNAQIVELTKQRDRLAAATTKDVERQSRDRSNYAARVTGVLRDPHTPIHAIYRAVMLAATMEQGSLWYPATFLGADSLGKQMVGLHEALTASETPRPALSITRQTYRPIDEDRDIALSYAMTRPGEGLTPVVDKELTATCGCGMEHYSPRPILALPVIEGTVGAVAPDAKRSFYRRSDSRIVDFRDGTRQERVLPMIQRDFAAKVPQIDLPTGNFFHNHELLGLYDSTNGVTEVTGPRKFSSFRTVGIIAVGERAVTRLLEDYCTEAKKALHPFVHADMADFVASSLGVTLSKRRKNAK